MAWLFVVEESVVTVEECVLTGSSQVEEEATEGTVRNQRAKSTLKGEWAVRGSRVTNEGGCLLGADAARAAGGYFQSSATPFQLAQRGQLARCRKISVDE